MKHSIHTAAIAAMVFLVSGAARPASTSVQSRPPAASEETLVVAGDVTQRLSIKLSDLKEMPRTTVTVGEDAQRIRYEGVFVGELLKRAGAPLGRDFSGKAVATYVRATAEDGYQVVFSLGELDPAVTSDDIVVADTIDGKPLPDTQGPFRIVAPHDKRGVRSIRMLQRLEVVRLIN